MILEIDNVELSFSGKKILNGIYLKAETGKVTGILGRNGSGKSVLLHSLFGTLRPKYRLVRVDGKPILKPLYLTDTVALLPQHPLVPDNLRLKSVFKLMHLAWDPFVREFEEFSAYGNAKAKILSGGERRILETYLILKSPKAAVLLDEPFSNMAPLHIERLKKIIEPEKQHKAIILTDHYYREVMEVSDCLYLLNNGYSQRVSTLEDLEDYRYLAMAERP